jgi:hypothetical protein
MNVEFDKRLELIYGILYCVNKDLNNNLFPGLFKEELPNYCNEFYDMYKSGITEDFIDFIKNYELANDWNQPACIALSLDNNYNIIENETLKERVILKNDKFNKEKLEKFLKEFVKNSNYEEFYNNHKVLYENIINEFKKSMSLSDTKNGDVITNFYGYKLGKMFIKLYNFTTGSMGILIGDNQYYIQRVANIGEDEKHFKFKPKFHVMLHEFSHPYIGPLVEKYLSQIDFTNFYNQVKKDGFSDVYTEMIPYQIFNEFLVRAISIYLESKFVSKEITEQRIEEQKANGFTNIDEVIEVLNNRDNYNSFEEFFAKEIVELCIDFNNRINNNKNL